MQSLIRPTLFMVARLGLFLAVVAWIVGQWWAVVVQVPMGAGGSTKEGCICGFVYVMSRDWSVRTGSDEIGTTSDFFSSPSNVDTTAWTENGFSVGGVTVCYTPLGTTIAFRHWLNLTILTAFNIALHFIYRKRPEGEPCEG